MTPARKARRERTYHHGDLRAALIAAATTMLEREGVEAISFRAIARKVGVSQTAPYNHFRSKEHLLATVAAEGFSKFTALQLSAAADARTPAERVSALGRGYVAFACAHPQLYRLMFGVGIANRRAYPELIQTGDASYAPVQHALAAHLATAGKSTPEALETAAVAAWALVHGLSMLLIDGKLDPSTMIAGDADTLVRRVTGAFGGGPSRAPKSKI